MILRLLLLLTAGCIALSCNKPQKIYLLRKDIIETVYASGKIIPFNEYSCYAQGNGTIVRKYVKDGDSVRKGQLLYMIRNDGVTARYQAALDNYHNIAVNLSPGSPLLRDLELSLQSADLRLKNDSLNYFRWKALWDQGIGTRSNLDNAFTNYQVSTNLRKSASEKYQSAVNDLRVNRSAARGQAETIRKEMSDYSIIAEKDGIVWQTLKESGEGVRANEVVALLGDSGRPLIRLAVDQEDVGRIQTGQRVLLKADLTGDSIYEAFVTRIYPTMNEQDQTFRVEAVFKDRVPPAFIHSSVEANIIVAERRGANVLQREAMAGADSIWILEGSKEKKVAVRTGLSTLEYIEILSGIGEKTTIIVKTGSR
jgi:multidrug efflux pump subunit AcrA (membrane-fusion protein)